MRSSLVLAAVDSVYGMSASAAARAIASSARGRMRLPSPIGAMPNGAAQRRPQQMVELDLEGQYHQHPAGDEPHLAQHLGQRRDYHRHQSGGHGQFVPHHHRHHELAAELRRRSYVVDSFAGDPRREQLAQTEPAGAVLDRHPPSERVGEARDPLQGDRQQQSPTRHAHVMQDVGPSETMQKPGVKAQREQDDEGFNASHQSRTYRRSKRNLP